MDSMARSHLYAQHFLKSPKLVAELVGHSNIRKNDMVYDLGAGSGIISYTLAARCRQVFAVEIEPQALKKLHQNVGDIANVSIVEKSIIDIKPPTEPYKIFANIPFNLSADVVRKFTQADLPPKSMYLVVQKQFARKLVSGDDHFTSQLAAEIGPWFTVRIRRPLRRTDFTPPPAVDTVLLEVKLRESPLLPIDQATNFRDFTSKCFSAQKYFVSLKKPFSSELRPSQLTLEQWTELYKSK